MLHSADAIDFATLRDKRVAVIGLAASAFDNAACALEAGAASVVMLGRSQTMPRVNKAKQIVYAGFVHGYPEMTDAERFAWLSYVFTGGISAPRESVQRVTRHAQARIQLGCEVTACRRQGDRLELETTTGPVTVDLVILGTGFDVDIPGTRALCFTANRPFANQLQLWRDRSAAREPTKRTRSLPLSGRRLSLYDHRR